MPPLLLAALALALALSHAAAGGGTGFYDPARVTQISWRPRAFLYSGFLSHAECDHLIKLAKGRLEKSMVADNESGKSVMSQVRTSSGTFLSKREVCNWKKRPCSLLQFQLFTRLGVHI
uniref:Prolyl 4-hydroxylase alpha subunit domain-containing protein n=1 Tax=Aegilops tauschii subsp. strangulata TaxID=200361 RepID=A0A453M4P6_AEGTS